MTDDEFRVLSHRLAELCRRRQAVNDEIAVLCKALMDGYPVFGDADS